MRARNKARTRERRALLRTMGGRKENRGLPRTRMTMGAKKENGGLLRRTRTAMGDRKERLALKSTLVDDQHQEEGT